jgi:hypothetical protein
MYALKQTFKQFVLANENISEESFANSKMFTTTMGLPCCHAIRGMIALNEILALEIFHAMWHLVNFNTMARTCEPTESQTNSLAPILQAVHNTFQTLTPHQQEVMRTALLQMAAQTLALEDPLAQRTRGRSPGSCNRRSMQSTARM